MNVRISRSARKHRLGAEHVVVPDDRNEGGLTVIHAMPTAWRRR